MVTLAAYPWNAPPRSQGQMCLTKVHPLEWLWLLCVWWEEWLSLSIWHSCTCIHDLAPILTMILSIFRKGRWLYGVLQLGTPHTLVSLSALSPVDFSKWFKCAHLQLRGVLAQRFFLLEMVCVFFYFPDQSPGEKLWLAHLTGTMG